MTGTTQSGRRRSESTTDLYSGYLTRLLIARNNDEELREKYGQLTVPVSEFKLTYRIDEGLLRELLEEAGYGLEYLSYGHPYESRKWTIHQGLASPVLGVADSLALAAMQALGLEVNQE